MKTIRQSFITLLLTVSVCAMAQAQTAESVYDRYTDFNMAKLQGQSGQSFHHRCRGDGPRRAAATQKPTSFYNA